MWSLSMRSWDFSPMVSGPGDWGSWWVGKSGQSQLLLMLHGFPRYEPSSCAHTFVHICGYLLSLKGVSRSGSIQFFSAGTKGPHPTSTTPMAATCILQWNLQVLGCPQLHPKGHQSLRL
jgi:hypothetical protein